MKIGFSPWCDKYDATSTSQQLAQPRHFFFSGGPSAPSPRLQRPRRRPPAPSPPPSMWRRRRPAAASSLRCCWIRRRAIAPRPAGSRSAPTISASGSRRWRPRPVGLRLRGPAPVARRDDGPGGRPRVPAPAAR